MSTPTSTHRYHEEILRHLLELADAGALPLAESSPGSSVYEFHMRAAGWPIVISLDATVLELRAYHGRDLITTGPVSTPVTEGLVGCGPAGQAAPTREQLAPLRATVKAWKNDNARLFMKSPDVARHPDGWNNA